MLSPGKESHNRCKAVIAHTLSNHHYQTHMRGFASGQRYAAADGPISAWHIMGQDSMISSSRIWATTDAALAGCMKH